MQRLSWPLAQDAHALVFLKLADTHLPARHYIAAAEKSDFQSSSLLCVPHNMAVDFLASSGWLCSPGLGWREHRGCADRLPVGGCSRLLPPQYHNMTGTQGKASTTPTDPLGGLPSVFDVGHFGGMWAVTRVERNAFRHRREGGGYQCLKFGRNLFMHCIY